MIRHYLNFISSGYGLKEIDEPFGFDKTPFGIKQEEGRKGRDVMYAGNGEAKFTISPAVDRFGFYFDVFLRDWQRYGFEVKIEYLCDFGTGMEVVGDVGQVTTNQIDEISFVVKQKLIEAKFKTNYDIDTNLFSPTDIDGNPIAPVQFSKMLLKAKPIFQESEWETAVLGQQVFADNPGANADYFNVIKTVKKSDIDDTLSWFLDFDTDSGGGFNNFAYVQFRNNAKNITVSMTLDVIYDYLPTFNNNLSGHAGQVLIRVYYGQDTDNYQQVNLWNSIAFSGNTNQQQILPVNLSLTIPFLNATDKIWISFVSATNNGAVNRLTFNKSTVKITATTIALNTVVPVIRYIDALNYTVKSSSGLVADAPRFGFGGEFYDQYITNTALMRNLTDKPYNISVKDFVEEHIRPEINGDYEIQANSSVFFGIYRDFYRNYEIGNFEQAQFDDYQKSINEKYACKQFVVSFKNYASKKENEQDNTYDIVHGESEWKTPNEQALNTREAKIGFIRDPFEIALSQRRSYDLTDTAATQDDDKTYIIDVVSLPPNTNFTETALLQHDYDPDTGRLTIRNNSTFSWLILGITPGSLFIIQSGPNEGLATVQTVSDTELKLSGIAGTDLLPVNTTFTYFIDPSVVMTNRTNEGFQEISGLADGNNYGNLRFTAKRILLNYYMEELATNCIFRQGEEVRNTLYKNNPDAVTQLVGGPRIVEGENITPEGAILTPFSYEMKLIMTLQEYWQLQGLMRSERGYIRTWDATGLPIKGYVKDGEWLPLNYGDIPEDERLGVFDCTIEEKYEPFIMTIFADGNTFVVNGEAQPSGFSFSIDELGYLSIFDTTGKLLHIPVQYDRVTFNGSSAETPSKLALWLSQYDINE